jgi:hypothetical protein
MKIAFEINMNSLTDLLIAFTQAGREALIGKKYFIIMGFQKQDDTPCSLMATLVGHPSNDPSKLISSEPPLAYSFLEPVQVDINNWGDIKSDHL